MVKVNEHLDFTKDEPYSEDWNIKVLSLYLKKNNVADEDYFAMRPADRARFVLDAVGAAQDGTLLEYWNSIKDEETEYDALDDIVITKAGEE